MERDVHGVTPGALDHPVQHALLDCHGNWIGVIAVSYTHLTLPTKA